MRSSYSYLRSYLTLTSSVTAWMFYRVSGSIFNPNVGLSLVLCGVISVPRFILYTLAQLVGSIVAAAILDGLTPGTLVRQWSRSAASRLSIWSGRCGGRLCWNQLRSGCLYRDVCMSVPEQPSVLSLMFSIVRSPLRFACLSFCWQQKSTELLSLHPS